MGFQVHFNWARPALYLLDTQDLIKAKQRSTYSWKLRPAPYHTGEDLVSQQCKYHLGKLAGAGKTAQLAKHLHGGPEFHPQHG